MAIDQTLGQTGAAVTLWQGSKCHLAYPNGKLTNRLHRGRNAIPELLQKTHGKGVADTETYRKYKECAPN